MLNCLASIGLKPENIDYLTYDHLHTQRVTRWLGDDDQPAIFPNAKLLVMREEWERAQSLIPWQNQWYCPDGIKHVPANKVVLLDNDVILGEGVALVRTKGHTEGNHSIVASTEGGIHVTSENGVSLDAYAPLHSGVPGVAEFTRYTGAEVILNGNTVEYGVDQCISMIQEKEIAGPSPRFDGYPNMAPSSEAQGHWLPAHTSHGQRGRSALRHAASADACASGWPSWTEAETMKTFLVTGAASGIGAQLATVLLQRGERVCAVDINPAPMDALKGAPATPEQLRITALDVRDAAAWDSLLEELKQQWGQLDALVNVAGVLKPGYCHESSQRQPKWAFISTSTPRAPSTAPVQQRG